MQHWHNPQTVFSAFPGSITCSCVPGSSCGSPECSPCCWITEVFKNTNKQKRQKQIKLSANIPGPEKGGQTLVKNLQKRKLPPGLERIRAQSWVTAVCLAPVWGLVSTTDGQICSLLDSKPRCAQMSVQFTAHSKVDHSSGVWFRPGTCYFSPSLLKKIKNPPPPKKTVE